jgi:isoquinoline 1-oxidoreductase beta subunit
MLNRRTFLQASSAAAGGMLMSLYIDFPMRAQAPAPPTYPPDAFIHLRPDGTIIIQVNRLEFGQGVQTALPMILADELDADWTHVVGELAPAADVYKDPIYQLQMTGGSISVPHSFQQYRELGATLRAMLVATAAARWRVAPAQCRTENSVVYGPASQSVRYADLAADAARQPVPGEVRLKSPSEFRLIGTPVRRLDSRAKCDGSLRFGIDVNLPGLKVALVARPPVFGGRVKSLDDREARAVAGARDVFEVPVIRGGTGIAVVADTFWMAKQARDRLRVEWDLSGVEHADTSQMLKRYAELSRTTGNVAVNRGDVSVLDRIPNTNRIVADFSFPYLAHTPMEPLNTTIRFDGDRAEAWVPSQFQTMDQIAIAEVLGLKPEQVTFHTEYAGGGFGRRTPLDSHVQREAAAIARRMRGTPVKVVWTREDDVQGGYYRPMFVHHVEVGVDARGLPAAWRHVVVGQSHIIGTGPPWEGALVKNGVDELVVEGTADSRYAIPNFHVSVHQPTVNVPVAQWRSVGMTHNAFVMETLIDELAMRAKIDPIAYRLALLRSDAKKLRRPLVLLEETTKAWRFRVPRNHRVGIACNEYHETGVACAVEVSVDNGRPRIHRATVTADVGMVINPLTLESQFQGGIVYGLSQLVEGGAVTFSDGRVDQRNFDDHTPPYMRDAPVAIDVHIVPSTEPPTACGECPVPVISPAVVNALFRLTGKRYRTLPLTRL